jgi:hypothetical protein
MTHYDFIVPVGRSCRPAGNLRDFGAYKYGLPFDWKDFSLDAFLHVLETDYADYFVNIEPMDDTPVLHGDTIYVRDRLNGIISAHDFKMGEDMEEQRVQLIKENRTAGRFMMKKIRKSEHVLLLSSRNRESSRELIDFLRRFSKLFPGQDITLLNIRHKAELPYDVFEKTTWSEGNLHFDEYAVNEVDQSVNHEQVGWKGNQRQWYAILSRYIPLSPAKPEWQP